MIYDFSLQTVGIAAGIALTVVFVQRVIYYLKRSRMEVYFNPTI